MYQVQPVEIWHQQVAKTPESAGDALPSCLGISALIASSSSRNKGDAAHSLNAAEELAASIRGFSSARTTPTAGGPAAGACADVLARPK
jgi:hypothetical protein